MQHSAAVTTVSRWLSEEAQAIVSMKPPIVAPMPVATELFTVAPLAVRLRRLLFVGRLMPQKGIDLLIGALAQLSVDVGLDVVGDGPDRAALEAQAMAAGVSMRVRFHGAVKQFELPAFYHRAFALVVPSAEEGLGLVAVEAQLCETPVIAFDSGGLPDVIQHERTGILVGERSAGALAAAIRSLLERDDLGATLGVAGRLHALATFAPESVARRYTDIYGSVVGRQAS
jgi:glycosyltransferase involved in cell wall biosynthesis